MSVSRRTLLQTLGSLAGATIGSTILNPVKAASILPEILSFSHTSPEEAARDEDFWLPIQQAYTSSSSLINLNNGGVSPHPKLVQEKVYEYTQFANEAPGFYMWRIMGKDRMAVRQQLAQLAGCHEEEVALMRNATEALETVIFGLDLKEGDEILTTDQDYPSMINSIKQRVRRDKISIRQIPLKDPEAEPAELVSAFKEAITPQTKVILVSHIINLTGRIMPVKEICDMAAQKGIQVIVDGAHSFANLTINLADLGCDYYGSSLHKWLSAPFGTGFLYVKKDRIADLWPMYGYPEEEHEQITKFEHLGTRSIPIELGISDAIRFHNGIGTARKYARLQYLKNYWMDQLSALEKVGFRTSRDPQKACGIATFYIEGIDHVKFGNDLLYKHRMYTTTVRHEDVYGIRVSPHVYTRLEDLDRFVKAIRALIA